MAKKRAAKDWDFDPRDAADAIEHRCFYAKMEAGSGSTPDEEIVISFPLPVAAEIAKMLRRVPRGNRRLTGRETKMREAHLEKARRYKAEAELIAGGKKVTKEKLAELLGGAMHRSKATWLRAMQKKNPAK